MPFNLMLKAATAFNHRHPLSTWIRSPIRNHVAMRFSSRFEFERNQIVNDVDNPKREFAHNDTVNCRGVILKRHITDGSFDKVYGEEKGSAQDPDNNNKKSEKFLTMNLKNNNENVQIMIHDKLKYPIGSLSDSNLQDIEESILSWASIRDRSSFEIALAALLRLADEQDFSDRERKAATTSINVNSRSTVDGIGGGDRVDDKYSKEEPESEESSEDRPPYRVRKILINRVLDCWRICWRDELIDLTPQEVLNIVEKLELQGVMPDCRTLTLIVDGMTLRGDPLEAPLLAQWLLDRRIGQTQRGLPAAADGAVVGMRPDAVFITTIIRAWAKSGRLEAPEMAEALLQLMHEYNDTFGWYECAPNTLSYTAAMEAWYRSRRPDACQEMHRLLNEMKTSSIEQVMPDQVTYGYVLNCLASSKDPWGAQKAQKLLLEMLQLYEEGGNILVAPKTSHFSKVMYALARKALIGDVKELSDRLERLYTRTGKEDFKPDDNCQKALLVALTKSGRISEADDILMEFSNRALTPDGSDGSSQFKMLRRSYFVNVLVAWTQIKNKSKGSERAHKLLMTMVELSKSGYTELMPDSKTFEKVVYSWAKSRDKNAPKQIGSILSTMEQLYNETGKKSVRPTAMALEMSLTCLSRSYEVDALQQALGILQEMDRRYSSGETKLKPTRGAYTTLMLTILRSKRKDYVVEIQKVFDVFKRQYDQGETAKPPDVHMYSVLMDSWAKHGKAEKVQSLFDEMINEAKNGNKEARPDIKAFNILLKAWGASRDNNRAQTAERLFNSMDKGESISGLKMNPNRQTFNEMIVIWASSGARNAAEMAEFYLRRLKESGFEPTVLSYRAVIDAWIDGANDMSLSSDADRTARATAILDELLHDVKSHKVQKPFYKPYMKFLQSIARSEIPGRNVQAKELLKSVQEDDVPKLLLPPLK